MDDWIVVGPVGAASASESNAAQATPKPDLMEQSPAEAADDQSQLNEPEATEPHLAEPQGLEAPAFAFNDVLRSVNEFQRAGLGLYDLYSDQLQYKLHEIKESAASRSRWALERARIETQRMLASLSATEVSEFVTQSSAEVNSHPHLLNTNHNTAMAPSASFSADNELEESISQTLVPVLFKARIPLYDGRNFKEWFAAAESLFDAAVPRAEQSCKTIVCGVKLYSVPSVAVIIDDADISGLRSKSEVVDFLTRHFEDRRARTRRYKELLRKNTPP